MKRTSSALLALLLLASCGIAGSDEPDRIEGLDKSAAIADAGRYLGDGSKILAVCGASKGVALYLDEYSEGYTPDGIDEGVIVFALNPQGAPEIVHRDALKQMVVMGEQPDGATITFLPNSNDDRVGMWIAIFPSSRVVEVHNLTIGEDGQLFDIWTSNKPSDAMIMARSMSFHSKCEFA